MAGPSNVKATDSKTVASLLDPACGIPFDVHFDIEDEEGTKLGTLGGHKNILALKSPVFKAMLFGPLKETGDHIRIKATSMFAFKTMLQYIHGVEEERSPWSLDVREIIRIADLAERYNMHGLRKKAIFQAQTLIPPKDKLVEVARVAEEFHVYKELSGTLLKTCAQYLLAILETPDDFNDFVEEWSGKSPEQSNCAFRLLARVDHCRMAYVCKFSDEGNELGPVVSNLRNIGIFNKPRKRLQSLITELDNSEGQDNLEQEIMEVINAHGDGGNVLFRSLWMCQRLDVEKAQLEGLPLTLDTLVEDHFTHEMSVRMHLDIIRLMTPEDEGWDGTDIDTIWTVMLRSIPEVKSIILLWFSKHEELFDYAGQRHLAEKLTSCGKAIKKLPGYASALKRYTEDLQ